MCISCGEKVYNDFARARAGPEGPLGVQPPERLCERRVFAGLTEGLLPDTLELCVSPAWQEHRGPGEKKHVDYL